MDAMRFDVATRSLATGPTRRGILAGVAGGVFAELVRLGPVAIAAGKNKKRRKKRKKASQPRGLTCADVCAGQGGAAWHLVEGGDLCGSNAFIEEFGNCRECSSDEDCFGMWPFCVDTLTSLSTGETSDLSFVCGPYEIGVCIGVQPCVVGA